MKSAMENAGIDRASLHSLIRLQMDESAKLPVIKRALEIQSIEIDRRIGQVYHRSAFLTMPLALLLAIFEMIVTSLLVGGLVFMPVVAFGTIQAATSDATWVGPALLSAATASLCWGIVLLGDKFPFVSTTLNSYGRFRLVAGVGRMKDFALVNGIQKT